MPDPYHLYDLYDLYDLLLMFSGWGGVQLEGSTSAAGRVCWGLDLHVEGLLAAA